MWDVLRSALRAPVLQAATWAYGRLRFGAKPQAGLRILTYHAVGTAIEGDSLCLYNMAPKRFKEHARHLARHYADHLVPFGSEAPAGNSLCIAVTFDDGYRDNLSIAAPLLSELRIPFTIFVCTGAVKRREQGFLTPEEVREIAGMPGARIGSHSVDHPRLTECDENRLRDELAGSKAFLEDLLGGEVDSLAYPHGAVDRRVRDMAESVGYCLGASSRFDINRAGRDPLLMCRTDIWAADEIPVFEQKLRGDWDWYRWRSADPDSKASRPSGKVVS